MKWKHQKASVAAFTACTRFYHIWELDTHAEQLTTLRTLPLHRGQRLN